MPNGVGEAGRGRHERRRGMWYVNFSLDRERICHLGVVNGTNIGVECNLAYRELGILAKLR